MLISDPDVCRAPGCDACTSGVRGRLALYEVLDLQALQGAAQAGLTSIDEVRRVS